jgi:hypothetical protein
MWFPFFGTWWWFLTALLILFVIIAEENDSAGGAFGILFAYLGVITIFGDGVTILKWIGNHPGWTFLGLIGYLVLGVPWARFWWKWKQSEKRDEYNEYRRKFLLERGIITIDDNHLDFQIPDLLLAEWNKSNNIYLTNLNKREFWTDHKDTLVCAMTWWPIHFGSFFLKDFIASGWKRMLIIFRAVFDKVDRDVWGDVEEDFRKSTPEQVATYEQERQANRRR